MDETENLSIGIIVLAAGASSRMKEPKQLLRFEGKSLLRRAALTAIEMNCQPVIVVLGANFEKTLGEIEDLPLCICRSENFREGLSSSIKSGLRELLKINPKIAAAIITLADQPRVTSEHLKLLTAKFIETGKNIVAAQYDENIGVPALFARQIFLELEKLEGDQGARKIIAKYPDNLEIVQIPSAAFDVDTPEDFKRLTETS